MRERWAEAFTARAAAYWTPERVRARLGDKQLLLKPVEAAPLLRALGILKRDASMTADTLRKYMQINHMVRLLRPFSSASWHCRGQAPGRRPSVSAHWDWQPHFPCSFRCVGRASNM